MLDSAAHPIWTLHRQEVMTTLGCRDTGLNDDEAKQRLTQFGPNALPTAHRRPLVMALADQMVHPMALLLWVGGGLALLAQTLRFFTIWVMSLTLHFTKIVQTL